MTDFSANQKLFAATLSKATGLDPNTVKAWLIAEEPAGAQSGYRGTQDWLNVGITDSGPQGSGNNVWKDPVAAANATANWIKGTWADPGFGKASSGIQSILRTVGQSPQAQLAAIAGSGWASSGYGGAGRLQSLLNTVKGIDLGPGGAVGTAASMAKVPMVNANFGTPGAPSGPAPPNVFDAIGGIEQARELLVDRHRGTTTVNSPVEQGWQALSNLFNGQQQEQAAKAAHLQAISSVNEPTVLDAAANSAANAPGSVKKILNMAIQAIGGPYSQAHHSSAFTASPATLRATGTDCSGFISWLMGPDGLRIWPNALATPDIPHAPGIQSGPGRNITIYNNPLPGNSGHVFIEIQGRFFQSAGGGVGIQPITSASAQHMIQHGDAGNPYYALHPKGY